MLKKFLAFSVVLNLLLLLALFIMIRSLGGFRYVWFKYQNKGATGVYEHRKDLFEELELDKESIVFLGNSIIQGCEWAELFDLPSIRNRGIAMDHTVGLLERLDPITEAKPAMVFLMVGVNDLIAATPVETAKNYKSILKQFKEDTPGTKLYVHSVLPVNNSVRKTGVDNADILELNKLIHALAKEFEYPYIDLHSILKDSKGRLDDDYTSDGIHLNAKAYLNWRAEIRRLGLIPEIFE